MPSANMEMLQTVAGGLSELNYEMVFVGGAVVELYTRDPAASDIRPTLDVDCIIKLSSNKAHAKLEEELRAKGFENDNLIEGIECVMPYGSESDSTDFILKLLKDISEIE